MKLFSIILLLLFYIACNTHAVKKLNSNLIKDTTSFFPVNDYLQTDIQDVNKTPYLIKRVIIENGKQIDSSFITKTSFNILATIFLNDSITAVGDKLLYHQDLFNDLTTKSITFTYTCLQKNLPVQNVSILLDEQSNQLKNIFISAFNKNDSILEEKLSWKAGKSFSINRAIKRNNTTLEQNIFVNWNDK
jgi:hypothetical protein